MSPRFLRTQSYNRKKTNERSPSPYFNRSRSPMNRKSSKSPMRRDSKSKVDKIIEEFNNMNEDSKNSKVKD